MLAVKSDKYGEVCTFILFWCSFDQIVQNALNGCASNFHVITHAQTTRYDLLVPRTFWTKLHVSGEKWIDLMDTGMSLEPSHGHQLA